MLSVSLRFVVSRLELLEQGSTARGLSQLELQQQERGREGPAGRYRCVRRAQVDILRADQEARNARWRNSKALQGPNEHVAGRLSLCQD